MTQNRKMHTFTHPRSYNIYYNIISIILKMFLFQYVIKIVKIK